MLHRAQHHLVGDLLLIEQDELRVRGDLLRHQLQQLLGRGDRRRQELARRLELPELPRLEDQLAEVFNELRRRDRWLLVYNNATDPAALDGVRPPAGGGHLLVTSRNPAWRSMATTLSVDTLDRGEAVTFLRQRTGSSDRATMERLAEALGDLPLALEQAAAYLEATSTPPGEYVELLGQRAPELFALGQPSNHRHTIATTWSVSLELLRRGTPVAEDLLQLCAFLAPDDISRSMVVSHQQVLPQRLRAAVEDQISYQQALGALTRYSLVSVTRTACQPTGWSRRSCVRGSTRMPIGGGPVPASNWSMPPFRRYPSRPTPGQTAADCWRTPSPQRRRTATPNLPSRPNCSVRLAGICRRAPTTNRPKSCSNERWQSAKPASALITSTPPRASTTWRWSCTTTGT